MPKAHSALPLCPGVRTTTAPRHHCGARATTRDLLDCSIRLRWSNKHKAYKATIRPTGSATATCGALGETAWEAVQNAWYAFEGDLTPSLGAPDNYFAMGEE